MANVTVAARIEAAAARQAEWEASLEHLLGLKVDRFMSEVVADAVAALDAPVLLAAADPFAFTNIMARWKLTVDSLMETPAARLKHPALLDEQIIHVLREASIPHEAADKARDVLTRYREESWSKAATRRELRAALIPKPPPGARENKRSVEWSWYKTRVRTIARTAATRATSLSTLEAGGDRKRWVSRHDSRVRHDHLNADGQTVPADGDFVVGGYSMQYPGDVSAPPEQTVNCRCVLLMLEDGEDEMTIEPDTLVAAGSTVFKPWAGPIAFEGIVTGDNRMMDHGTFYWEDLPLSLRKLPADYGRHDGAVAVGRVDRIERRPGGVIWGEGVIDMSSEHGVEAARLIDDKISNGVSVDPDDVSFEIRIKAELLDSMLGEDPEGAGFAMADGEGRVTVLKQRSGDQLEVWTAARIRGVTLCDIPAFSQARIGLLEDAEYAAPVLEPTLVASSAPSCPPLEWFEDPKFDGPAAMTVTDEGRVFGHAAAWESCHISYPGECKPPPRSPSGYAYFHTGAMHVMANGQVRKIAIGRLTVGTGHAGDRASAAATLAHYDNTGTAVAYVRAGEDQYGIWIAGAILPQATDEQVRTLMASPPSGDWRTIGGQLEMVAVLHVNVGGFALPRPAGFIASGEVQSLVAAGMVECGDGKPAMLDDAERRFVRELMAERRLAAAARLAGRVQHVRARVKVDSMAKRRGQHVSMQVQKR